MNELLIAGIAFAAVASLMAGAEKTWATAARQAAGLDPPAPGEGWLLPLQGYGYGAAAASAWLLGWASPMTVTLVVATLVIGAVETAPTVARLLRPGGRR